MVRFDSALSREIDEEINAGRVKNFVFVTLLLKVARCNVQMLI